MEDCAADVQPEPLNGLQCKSSLIASTTYRAKPGRGRDVTNICHRRCDQTVADGGQNIIVSDSSRKATVAQRSSPSLRLRQTTLHFRTGHSPPVGMLEAPRTHEIGQRRTQPVVVTETSDPRDVRLPTQCTICFKICSKICKKICKKYVTKYAEYVIIYAKYVISMEYDMCSQKYAKYAIKYAEYAKYVLCNPLKNMQNMHSPLC